MKASKALSAWFLVSAIQISWRARFAFECRLLGSLLSTLAVLCILEGQQRVAEDKDNRTDPASRRRSRLVGLWC